MKNLALALIASAVTVSAVSANISTGAYLGAHVGYGSTTGNYTTTNTAGMNLGNINIGSTAANIGIMGGYGWVIGCLYVGGKLAYTFENTKVNGNFGSNSSGNGGVQLKRNGYFNAALRGGYLFTPHTMGYIRLGGNWGKYTLTDSGIGNAFTMMNTARGSRNTLSFAPGVGIETAVHKHVYLRIEYNYEFGPSVRATSMNLTNANSNVSNIRTQSGKVGLTYKF